MRKLLPMLFVLLSVPSAFTQPEQNLVPVFDSAAREFSVPSALLKGIAFVETRWMQVRPGVNSQSHDGMPAAYGVMGLRDDDWFGRSLQTAARLIGRQPATLKEDATANIRGAAALIASLAAGESVRPSNDDLPGWFAVLAKYSGIPQRDIKGSYAEHVYDALAAGYTGYGIFLDRSPIDLARVREIAAQEYGSENPESPTSDDYGPAVWDASPNYGSRAGSPITHVIIHDTEGSFDGSVSWLKNPAAQASAHYIFRSADGYLKQLVREADKAWHVVCWNAWTVGIEHEGYVDNPAYFTDVMYRQSALLTRHLTDRYNIPRNRLRIVGHNVWQNTVIFPQLGWSSCNDHTDPGQYWNWDYYLSLVVVDSTPPRVVRTVPQPGQPNVPIYKTITLNFDRPMDVFSAQAGSSVNPPTPGSFKWSDDAMALSYVPASLLTPATTYTVGLAATAKSAGGGALQAPVNYSFVTAAVDTVGPRIAASCPINGASGVSPATGFQILFDKPVVYSSLSGHIRLVDAADSSRFIGIGNIVYANNGDDQGFLTLTPAADLQLGHTYRLRLLPGLRDPLNNASSFESRVEFTVQAAGFPQGTVIDQFETNSGQWQQPQASPGTFKIDAVHSSYGIVSTYFRTGAYSGQLTYAFSDTTGGICAVSTLAPIPVSVQNGWLGVWVFGDNSGNQLEFWFTNSAGSTQIVPLGRITWFGWNFVTTPVLSSMTSFTSFVVRQMNGAGQGGNLYFDDLQFAMPTGVAASPGIAQKHFALYQNYPNPFNPVTTISFSIAHTGFVRVRVLDVLGREVTTLVGDVLDAGIHNVQWNASNAGSGVYFCELQADGARQTRRMILLK